MAEIVRSNRNISLDPKNERSKQAITSQWVTKSAASLHAFHAEPFEENVVLEFPKSRLHYVFDSRVALIPLVQHEPLRTSDDLGVKRETVSRSTADSTRCFVLTILF